MSTRYTTYVTLIDLHLFDLRLRYVALLAAGVLALLLWVVRFLSRIVSARVMAGVPNCPGCASTSISKAFAKGIRDAVFPSVRLLSISL